MWRDWTTLPPIRRGLMTSRLRQAQALAEIERGWEAKAEALRSQRGRVPGLVISLTSHAPRFATLVPTLQSLLLQHRRAQAVVLWIGHGDMAALPPEVLALREFGLAIEACDDHGPHTKYVHALERFPEAAIAICDDDTYYPPRWLGGLADSERSGEIPCYRIHRVALGLDGAPLGYRHWDHDSADRAASTLNFPTGVGGVLLRREKLHKVIADTALARRLCATTDDIWIYAAGRLAGTDFRLIGDHNPLTVWRSSQFSALWKVNVLEHANDLNMQAIVDQFGRERLFGAARSTLAA